MGTGLTLKSHEFYLKRTLDLARYRIAGAKLQNDQRYYLFSSFEPYLGCGSFSRYTNTIHTIWTANDSYKGSSEILKSHPKMQADFIDIKFVAEPDSDLRVISREMLFKFLTAKGSLRAAQHFRPD